MTANSENLTLGGRCAESSVGRMVVSGWSAHGDLRLATGALSGGGEDRATASERRLYLLTYPVRVRDDEKCARGNGLLTQTGLLSRESESSRPKSSPKPTLFVNVLFGLNKPKWLAAPDLPV